MIKRLSTVSAALLASGALLLCGCSAESADTGAGIIQVVATTTQLGDFTRNVIGDVASEVTQLVDPGQGVHSFDPSAGDLVAIGQADVLVVNGAGFDAWIDDAIDASGFEGVVVDTSAGVDLLAAPEEDEHGHDHANETADGHAEHSEHTEHADSGQDPHIWHDVNNAILQVEAISQALGEADPEHKTQFEANAAAYVAQLDTLKEWIHANVDQVPVGQRLLVTSHDAFGYLIADLGISYVGAVIPSLDDTAEASVAHLDELIAQIKQSGVRAVFAETSINPAAAKTIAAETGAAVYAGDDALYSDSLGVQGSPGESYIGSMVHNVTVLLASWGVTSPTPVPDVINR